MRRVTVFLALVGLVSAVPLLAGCSMDRVEPADLVLHNGKVVTLDAAVPEAQGLAVTGDTIVAVGSNEVVRRHIGEKTEVIDLAGRLAIPGFTDSHVHFTGIGEAQTNLRLMDTKSWDEIVSLVEQAAKKAKPGEWILGRGWHQEKWSAPPSPSVEGFPTHDSLSRVSPDNPVILTHASGHATFANAKAMELAGITKATPNPPGGEILRDARGNPVGVFRERASNLVRAAYQKQREGRTAAEIEAETRRLVELASEECLSKGITSVHDAGTSFEVADIYRKMGEEGKLGVRVYAMIRETNERLAPNLARYRWIGAGNKHVTVRAIKVSIDGALGPRGAWLLEPYSDLPSSTGLNTGSMEALAETARLALQHDYQLAVHAIGDRANRETLNVYEEAFKAHPDKKDTRWRIEHSQHLHPSDIPRFGRLGVVPSMQGIHCTSDGPYVLARLGPKRAEEGAYVWRKLMASGATIINGTDAPVEDVSALASFYSSVTRRMKNGEVFYGDQKMTREEALRSYTSNPAWAAFEEAVRGTLAIGKLADITVLSKDILTIPDDEIPSTEVVATIVGGKVRYRRK
ncbi:MAG: amidohydrolase [Vicinamibacterales bacterium]